jgi:parallel beta-helix repeat protein
VTAVPAATGNGITSTGVTDLLFQSIKMVGQESNGIFSAVGDNLVYRDIVGDGLNTSLYSVFPVTSSNVVIEGCLVERVIDAGVYVGQSSGIIVRHNRIQENVAGLEIENSQFAEVYGNLATNNAGGILEFKLPGLANQNGNDNYYHHNVSISNNRESSPYTLPGAIVGVIPTGTGYLTFSNDFSVWSYNLSRDNGSFGFAMLDQEMINALGDPMDPAFDPVSPDQATTGNLVAFNQFNANGDNPDTTPPNATPLSKDMIFALNDDQGGNHNNCFTGNSTGINGFMDLTPSDCTP